MICLTGMQRYHPEFLTQQADQTVGRYRRSGLKIDIYQRVVDVPHTGCSNPVHDVLQCRLAHMHRIDARLLPVNTNVFRPLRKCILGNVHAVGKTNLHLQLKKFQGLDGILLAPLLKKSCIFSGK